MKKFSTLGKSIAKYFLITTLLSSVVMQTVILESQNVPVDILGGWLTTIVMGLLIAYFTPLKKTVLE
jgi:hypothetical protein